jgi:hypothetical protein
VACLNPLPTATAIVEPAHKGGHGRCGTAVVILVLSRAAGSGHEGGGGVSTLAAAGRQWDEDGGDGGKGRGGRLQDALCPFT